MNIKLNVYKSLNYSFLFKNKSIKCKFKKKKKLCKNSQKIQFLTGQIRCPMLTHIAQHFALSPLFRCAPLPPHSFPTAHSTQFLSICFICTLLPRAAPVATCLYLFAIICHLNTEHFKA